MLTKRVRIGVVALALALALAGCGGGERELTFGFYSDFRPVSYAGGASNTHMGYEADLLTALEAMDGLGLSFERRPIDEWDGIWLKSAGPDYDVVGGGITILDSRTRDGEGNVAVAFTNGHITFRQSLLVRAEDAERLARHSDLTSDVRVGVFAGTTGEARLLQLAGLADADGVLAAGVRVETPSGEVAADGSPAYTITAAAASASLADRRALFPPDDASPQVVYFDDEAALLDALRDGLVDALARGEIGNLEAAREDGLAVTALDAEVEYGGFTVAAGDEDLLRKLNEHIDWLTDNRRIGYAEYLADQEVFMKRAEDWNRRP